MSKSVPLFGLSFLAVTFGAMNSVLASSFLPDILRELLASTDEATAGRAGAWVNFAFLAGGTVGGIALGFLSDRIGRRAVQIACFALCFGLSFLIFQTKTGYGLPAKIGIALLGWVFGVSQGVLNDYIPALFPPVLRSSATGLCFHIGRAFTAAAVFFVGAFAVWFGGYGNAIFAFSTVYLLGLAGLVFGKTRPV